MSPEGTPPVTPWFKKVPWWGWAAAVAVLLLAGGIQNIVERDDSEQAAETAVVTPEVGAGEVVEEVGGADTDDGTVVGDAVPEAVVPTGAQVITHITTSLGYPDLDAACADGILWACNFEEVTVNSTEEVTVIVTEPHSGVNPTAVGTAVFNFVTTPLDEGTTSLLPDLKVVTVMDTNGVVLATKKA